MRAWASGARCSSRSRCSPPGTRSSASPRSAGPTSRRSARCRSCPSSPVSCATGHAERVADLSVAARSRAAPLRRRTSSTCAPRRCSTTSATSASTIPRSAAASIEPSEVTDKGAEILRQTDYLRPAGDLLASDTASVGSQILRVASAFDELTAGDPAFSDAAIEALYSGPGLRLRPAGARRARAGRGQRPPGVLHPLRLLPAAG